MVSETNLALDFPLSHSTFFCISKTKEVGPAVCLGCSPSWEYPYFLLSKVEPLLPDQIKLHLLHEASRGSYRPQGELLLPMSLPLLCVLHSLQAWTASGGLAVTSLGMAHLWN